ncbi:arginine deiminase-related protein [Mucilaginibacter sabulilitoris]|uniref:Arginine deiminase-related protein n=1 Tax=Mucilaginibacter sabulilitoris TaxID=1173583 RepID=A0ABZ0TXQ8_9SPHI|nr:arginine deiminase-related protein [Mucilaginibacter sabulilitoris]WPU96858.1 arginine deiminase-related protein [Mucilaginibacter sabulilitoris]
MQSTNSILMIRPVSFGFNEQTADSNAFQNRDADQQAVQDKALAEFNGFVNTLKENGVSVTVIDDTPQPHTPDSIFPNNWVSFHADGNVFLYPMQAENRRLERREDIISKLEDSFKVAHVIDLSRFEAENKFLEGTGSMVLDRENKIAYAGLSPRTDQEVLKLFGEQAGYKIISFEAAEANGKAIYHTNVLMCIGSGFAVICADSIPNPHEKVVVLESLRSTRKEVITISFDQMNRFAGNMLEVKSNKGETLIVMSQNAYQALDEEQRLALQKYGKLVYADINTIETNGGGSARCMMAEVHLPVGK